MQCANSIQMSNFTNYQVPISRLEIGLASKHRSQHQEADKQAATFDSGPRTKSYHKRVEKMELEYPIVANINEADRVEFVCLSLDGKYWIFWLISNSFALLFAVAVAVDKQRKTRKKPLSK